MPTLTVPHIKQNGETHCGVACLEMIYRYFGITDITQDDIWKKRKTIRPDKTGEFMMTNDMTNDLFENDFQVLQGQFSLELEKCARSIKNLLDTKTPIIACKQVPTDPIYGHFVVIIGIEEDTISYLDPEKDSEIQKKSVQDFIKEWQKTGEEVIGGEFIAMGKDDKPLQIKKLHLTNFWTPNDIKGFCLESLDF